MITKICASMDSPRKVYVLPSDYAGEEGMITSAQVRTLTRIVMEKVENDCERNRWLSQISDMSSVDAKDAIFELLISG